MGNRPQGGGGASRPPRENQGPSSGTTALARVPQAVRDLVKPYERFAELTQSLANLSENCNLLTPAISGIPQGWAVGLSLVLIREDGDTYPVEGGKRGIGKAALTKVAAAAGVSWDHRASGRKDSGKDPRYCYFLAVGHYRDTDGTWRTISAYKELDLRDGSDFINDLREQGRKKNAEALAINGAGKGDECRILLPNGKPADPDDVTAYNAAVGAWWDSHDAKQLRFFPKRITDPESQIRQMRQHIHSHAETKARLRAVRDGFGLQSSYTSADIAKPFVVAKPFFHGKSGNAALDAEVFRMSAQAALGSAAQAFGSERGSLPGPGEGPADFPMHEPPDLDHGGGSDDDGYQDMPEGLVDPNEDGVIEAEFEPVAEGQHRGAAQGAGPAAQPAQQGAPVRDRPSQDQPVEGEPGVLNGLDREGVAAQVLALAAQKGRHGDGDGQISAVKLERKGRRVLVDAYVALSALPDIQADLAFDDEPIAVGVPAADVQAKKE